MRCRRMADDKLVVPALTSVWLMAWKPRLEPWPQPSLGS